MMRRFLLTTFLVCLLHVVYAQIDYCADIVRDTDKVTKVITCTGPDMSMMLKAVISGTDTAVSINFNIKELIASDEAGLYIRLDDGHLLRYFGQRITKTWLNAKEGYHYETVLPCSPAMVQQLKAKKIKVFQIAGIDVTVNAAIATEFQAYVNCIVK